MNRSGEELFAMIGPILDGEAVEEVISCLVTLSARTLATTAAGDTDQLLNMLITFGCLMQKEATTMLKEGMLS